MNEITAAQRPTRARKIFQNRAPRGRALSFRTEDRNPSYIVAPADVFTRMPPAVRRKRLHSKWRLKRSPK